MADEFDYSDQLKESVFHHIKPMVVAPMVRMGIVMVNRKFFVYPLRITIDNAIDLDQV